MIIEGDKLMSKATGGKHISFSEQADNVDNKEENKGHSQDTVFNMNKENDKCFTGNPSSREEFTDKDKDDNQNMDREARHVTFPEEEEGRMLSKGKAVILDVGGDRFTAMRSCLLKGPASR